MTNINSLKQLYLNEQRLGEYLQILFNTEIIIDSKVPNSNSLKRPDFRIEKYKLLIEFDGESHFTNPITILSDIQKEDILLAILLRQIG